MKTTPHLSTLAVLLFGAGAFAGDEIQKNIIPAETQPINPWSFAVSLPGWIPWQTGEVGINGATSHIKLGPNDLIPKIDMIAGVRAEAHYERLGLMGEYSYMSLSDGVGATGPVKKLDVRMDQTLAELAVSWRVVEGPRGWLDAFAGARYTNLYQAVGIHPDSGAIQNASQGIVDALAARISAGLRERVDSLVQQAITNKLTALQERSPTVPQGPVADALRNLVARRVQSVIRQRVANLQAAIQSGVQSRVAAAKAKLTQEIASAVTDKLNTKVSRFDDWVDPIVGLRGRYYLSKAFYLTGRADIGGFGLGSELAWQVNAGLGCQLARNLYTETTYRIYDVNYRHNGLTYDVLTHGIELSMGLNF